MEFRIASTFTDSLAKLDNQQQKAAKMTAFELQLNPAHPSLKFHRLARAKDAAFWSVRINRDLRLIVHKTEASLLLCYVDHHDAAYAWAEQRKIERHPTTGAAQLVKIRERVEEIQPPPAASVPPAKPALFAKLADAELLAYGVPAEWLDTVRQANEDSLFDLAEDLPQEAIEALLDLATGATPPTAQVTAPAADPFSHPDAQRRFRLLGNVEELQRALDYPWEKWTVFLHPTQRQWVERDYSGPARIAGSAGTGKTIVALHRAVRLARRHPAANVLLTTFSNTLATALQVKLDRLIGNESSVRARITVRAMPELGAALYAQIFEPAQLADAAFIQNRLATVAASTAGFSLSFLLDEWHNVVDAWQVRSWEAYREVPRLGRKTRLGGKQRQQLWTIFEQIHAELDRHGKITQAGLFARLADHFQNHAVRPFDFAVVDEAQDIGVTELKFLAVLGARHPDSLFFTGDLGQRIFRQPFSWKTLGVDLRGRSHTLRINYRTSHQIRSRADRLLPASIADVDGNEDSRQGLQSVFNGPAPEIQIGADPQAEAKAVGAWLAGRLEAGVQAHEIGLFVRSEAQLERARQAAAMAQVASAELADGIEHKPDHIALGVMHLAKGLEFRAVAVMACDDDVLPLQARIENVVDAGDLAEIYHTERHLLYVACTRARDWLLVSGVMPASEFIDDLL